MVRVWVQGAWAGRRIPISSCLVGSICSVVWIKAAYYVLVVTRRTSALGKSFQIVVKVRGNEGRDGLPNAQIAVVPHTIQSIILVFTGQACITIQYVGLQHLSAQRAQLSSPQVFARLLRPTCIFRDANKSDLPLCLCSYHFVSTLSALCTWSTNGKALVAQTCSRGARSNDYICKYMPCP